MKIKILSLLCLVIAFGSCNKWLEVDLIDRVNEDKLFSKATGFDEALAGAYSDMAKSSLYGQNLTYGYLDCYAQYYTGSSDSYKSHIEYDYKNATVKSTHASIWNNMYSIISSANNILRWTDINASVLGEYKRNLVKGEAVAIRAFIHFDLIRMFCPDIKVSPKENGIPYNKTFGVSLPIQYTVEECVQLVLNDLNEAEQLLTNDPITSVAPYTSSTKNEADKYVARMNIYAVKAMKARLYLMRGDYDNAAKYAKEVIDSKMFRLLEFPSIDANEKEIDILFSDEHIFSLRNKNISEQVKKLFVNESKDGVTSIAPISFKDTYSIYESNTNDVRYIKWFESVGQFAFLKYTKDNSEVFFPKVPMIRLAEMYLIMAESVFDTNPDQSLEYINAIRDHRIKNNAKWQYLTKDYIFDEMRREFMAEGQLWFAYKRLNKAISTGSVEGDIQPSKELYVFPLPDKEVDTGNRPQ